MKRKIQFLITILLLFISLSSNAQNTFQKYYTGQSNNFGDAAEQTIDGGYIIVGGNAGFHSMDCDVYLIKTDAIGSPVWSQIFNGSSGWDEGYSVKQTNDGGYILCGANNTGNVYIIRTNNNGDTLWTKAFSNGYANSIQLTNDNGFILVGRTSLGSGLDDVYLLKLDSNGNLLWSKTFGGSSWDWGYDVHQTFDGGFIIAAQTESFGADSNNIYLLKTDFSGNLVWSKSFGGTVQEWGYAVQQTADSGYIVVGGTSSFDSGAVDVYVIRTNVNGDTLWTRTYGSGSIDYNIAYSIQQTNDGGFVICGETNGFGLDTLYAAYLIKIDGNGNVLWSNIYGTYVIANTIRQTSDKGYIISCTEDIMPNVVAGIRNIYLIKTDSVGNSGCAQNAVTTIMTRPSTQVTTPPTITTSPTTTAIFPITTVTSGVTVTTLCSYVGIHEFNEDENILSIYPNPVINKFTITINSNHANTQAVVYDLMGKEVMRQNLLSSSITIERGSLESGVYFVRVISNERQYVQKMVVE